MTKAAIQSKTIFLKNASFQMHYLESNSNPASDEVILLLHGWPTSSFLYRKMIEPLSSHHRTIAIDLPGFGGSDKNPDGSFSFPYHADIIQEFLELLQIKKVHLVVHDLGGPIGMWWAQRHTNMVCSYVLLDTLIFPKFSRAVKIFVGMSLMPFAKSWLSSDRGIRWAMKFGIYNTSVLTPDVLAGYTSPYADAENPKKARKALLKSASRLHMKGFDTIVQSLDKIKIPMCMIYAEHDKILPKVKETFTKIQAIVTHAELHMIPDCGHFLQEERPKEIVDIMSRFYSK